MSPREKPKKQPQKKTINRKWLVNTLLLTGVALLVLAVFILKQESQAKETALVPQETPEEQLDRLLEAGEPIFLFFHSNNCNSCLVMIDIVNQVYPEFMEQISLIDVNVYDEQNQNLLRRARITTIPTQVFIDASGQGNVILGVMQPEVLRDRLSLLIEEQR